MPWSLYPLLELSAGQPHAHAGERGRAPSLHTSALRRMEGQCFTRSDKPGVGSQVVAWAPDAGGRRAPVRDGVLLPPSSGRGHAPGGFCSLPQPHLPQGHDPLAGHCPAGGPRGREHRASTTGVAARSGLLSLQEKTVGNQGGASTHRTCSGTWPCGPAPDRSTRGTADSC